VGMEDDVITAALVPFNDEADVLLVLVLLPLLLLLPPPPSPLSASQNPEKISLVLVVTLLNNASAWMANVLERQIFLLRTRMTGMTNRP